MRIRIQSKILASFMAMVALIIALLLFTLFSIRIMADGTRRLVYVQKKAGLITDLQMTLDRAVTALGEYMVSGKKSRRATFIQLVLFYTRNIEALERSSLSGPAGKGAADARERAAVAALKADIAVIDRNAREILSLVDRIERAQGHRLIQDVAASVKNALEKKAEGGGGGAPSRELAVLGGLLGVSTRDAQRRLAELEVLSRTISESESRLKELSLQLIEAKDRALERIAELHELAQREGLRAIETATLADRRARKISLVGGVIVLACGLVLALYLSRSFSRPISDLDRGARLIGEGDFDHRMVLDTGDELQDLAERFNTMARRLKASYGELEERVRDRTRELEASNLQLRRLFNGISDGISVIDRGFRIVNVNAGIAAMAGRDGAELVGAACHRAYRGSDTPCPGCPVAETFRCGTTSSGEVRWEVPGGKARDVEIFSFPLLEEEGAVTHVIEYAKDISERKALERKLFQSAKLAGIGTLAAGVAHEIRNPLGIMKASADMIRRGSREGEQNWELAGFLMEEVDRLNRVVTRLLDFARPSAPRSAPCDLAEILERALALVGPQHRLQDVEVDRAYAPGVPRVRGDGEQLCQVFLNLILNAVQAMSGKGRLSLSTGAGEGETVVASVGDSGGGIAGKDLAQIFDPFFSTKEGGAGLGLAIVYRIVEAHKGRIEVNSTPGKGTTFTVTLPVA
jgi:PAS domain S-box-containing protein